MTPLETFDKVNENLWKGKSDTIKEFISNTRKKIEDCSDDVSLQYQLVVGYMAFVAKQAGVNKFAEHFNQMVGKHLI